MAKALLVMVAVGALMTAGARSAPAADMKPIHTQKVKDVLVTLESESGQWKPGKNDFVLTFTSAQDKQPVDAGQVSLNTSMAMPGMAPMLGGQKALSPDNNLTVGLSLPLDLNGRKEGRVAVAEREFDMKRAQVAEVERRLRADVRTKAGDLLAARRNLAVTDDLLTVNRDALRLVQSRVGQGASPSVDEGLQLVEVNRLEASRQMLTSRVEIVTLQLRALAGMAADAPLVLRGELHPGPLPTDRVEAARRAMAGRPDLAGSRADVAAARARIRKEQADGRWDATVNVGYQRQDF